MAEKPTGATVSVGCKLPGGLLLEKPNGDKVRLRGSNTSNVIGGYGITEGIDEAWFTAWLKDNARFEPVSAGLIFAQSTTARAQDQARDLAGVKSGFEPVDPDNPGPKLEPVPV